MITVIHIIRIGLAFGFGLFFFFLGIAQIKYSLTLPEKDDDFEEIYPVQRKIGDFGFILGSTKMSVAKENAKHWRSYGITSIIISIGLLILSVVVYIN